MGLFLLASFRPGISYLFIVDIDFQIKNPAVDLDFMDSAYQANSSEIKFGLN